MKDVKYCKYCGKKMQDNHLFCTKCGEKLIANKGKSYFGKPHIFVQIIAAIVFIITAIFAIAALVSAVIPNKDYVLTIFVIIYAIYSFIFLHVSKIKKAFILTSYLQLASLAIGIIVTVYIYST